MEPTPPTRTAGTAPMAAAIETMKLIRETDYLERTQALGQRLRTGLDEAADRHGFALRQSGPAELPLIMFADDPGFSRLKPTGGEEIGMHSVIP